MTSFATSFAKASSTAVDLEKLAPRGDQRADQHAVKAFDSKLSFDGMSPRGKACCSEGARKHGERRNVRLSRIVAVSIMAEINQRCQSRREQDIAYHNLQTGVHRNPSLPGATVISE